MHNKLTDTGKVLYRSLRLLLNNDPLRLAGATAFFTTFALPPILLILIQLLGLLFNRRHISIRLFQRLAEIVGSDSARQVLVTLRGFRGLAHSWPVATGGFLFLIFVATTLFKVIKNSMNQLWMIRTPARQNIWSGMLNRLRSLAVILAAGVFFVASLLAESLQALLGNYIAEIWPDAAFAVNDILTQLIAVVIVTAWFSILFRYLPDGKTSWAVTITGGFVTSLLFNAGKFLLRRLLYGSNIGSLYGASASVVLLLLFVFYASFILYYGVAFTREWGVYKNKPVQPLHAASLYEWKDVLPR